MACIFTLLAALLIAAPLAAEGPVSLKDDSRLQTKVTLKLACEPVSTLAETLEDATGVTITVRKDVADLNVTAYATDIPAWEAMSRIALVLRCNWEVVSESPGKYGYALFRPLKKKQEADTLRQAYWNEQDRRFRDTIEDAIKLVDADPETLQEEARKNPAQLLRNVQFRETLQDLACFTKAQRDDIWARTSASGQAEIRIPFTELPPRLQERFRKRVDEIHQNRPDGSPSGEGIEARKLIVSRGGGYGSPRISALPLQSRIAYFGLSGIGGSAGMGVVPPDQQLFDHDISELQQAGIDTSFIKPFSPDFVDQKSKTKRLKIEWPEEGEKKDEPAPTGFVVGRTSDRASHSSYEVLSAASRMFRVNVFAPDYICRLKNGTSLRTAFPNDLEEALGEICREFEYEVSYDESGCIALQCKTWFMEEARETPKRLVLRWADMKKKQGGLQFKDYLEITRELSNLQIESLSHARIDGEAQFLWEVMHLGDNTDRVRLASMLTADQMKKARQGGLAYREMKRDQQQLFAYHLGAERPDLTQREMQTCLFSMREIPGVNSPDQRGQDTVIFTYTYGPEDKQEFTMELPRAD